MRAVIFGAGSIGRGFISQLMHRSGFNITLVDVDENLLNRLQENGYYTLELVSGDYTDVEKIPVDQLIHGGDIEAVMQAVVEADIIFTAVGVGALKHIAKPIAYGLKKRQQTKIEPINIILCENLMNVHEVMQQLIQEQLHTDAQILNNTGLIRASVGRMVPLPESGADPLIIRAEPYYHLPIDADCIVGDLPDFLGLERISPFGYAMEQKLYIHNLGHAACAWLGYQHSYRYIYQVVEDPKLYTIVKSAMEEAAKALAVRYNRSLFELEHHIDDLLYRFANIALGDTVQRVGRDTRRKLKINDRAVGALKACKLYNLPCDTIIYVIAAGFTFINEDEGTNYVQSLIRQYGIEFAISEITDLDEDSIDKITLQYNKLI